MSWKDLIALASVKRDVETGEIPAPDGTVVEENNSEESGMWDDLMSSDTDLDPEGIDNGGETDLDLGDETDVTEDLVPAEKTPPVTEEPAPVEVVVPEVVVPPVEEQPTEPTPAQAPTPEQQQAQQVQLAEARGKVLEHLSELYALSESDSESLQLEPETVLPKLAAQLHLNITEALQAGIYSQLPEMMKRAQQESTTQEENVGAFYKEWPALQDAKHADTVLRVMKAYRAQNPGVPREQIIREGGAMAMIALKLPITNEAPAEVVSETRVRPVVPASPGGSVIPANSRQQGSENAFTQMFLDVIEEDL